ncbi:MAG TPA: hypothetical protein EYM95_13920 [Candidatus Obscuribacterales bacterium]|nr:hypothetical protein [Candidatus Obscuribacterales bacterium]
MNAKLSLDTNTLVTDANRAGRIDGSKSSNDKTVLSTPIDASLKSIPPANEATDFRISGHDKIRMIAVLITLIVFEPLYGRLALPIDPSEMRDDGPFFMLAKYLVELNNHMAHHIAWQWVVPVLLAVAVYKILNKLLQDADD